MFGEICSHVRPPACAARGRGNRFSEQYHPPFAFVRLRPHVRVRTCASGTATASAVVVPDGSAMRSGRRGRTTTAMPVVAARRGRTAHQLININNIFRAVPNAHAIRSAGSGECRKGAHTNVRFFVRSNSPIFPSHLRLARIAAVDSGRG